MSYTDDPTFLNIMTGVAVGMGVASVVSVINLIADITGAGWKSKKFKKYTRKMVVKMFHDIEKYTKLEAKNQTKGPCERGNHLYSHIAPLKELVRANHVKLKPEQFTELMYLLIMIEKRVDKANEKKESIGDAYYEVTLKRFKKIEWLNLGEEEWNFKVEKQGTEKNTTLAKSEN